MQKMNRFYKGVYKIDTVHNYRFLVAAKQFFRIYNFRRNLIKKRTILEMISNMSLNIEKSF